MTQPTHRLVLARAHAARAFLNLDIVDFLCCGASPGCLVAALVVRQISRTPNCNANVILSQCTSRQDSRLDHRHKPFSRNTHLHMSSFVAAATGWPMNRCRASTTHADADGRMMHLRTRVAMARSHSQQRCSGCSFAVVLVRARGSPLVSASGARHRSILNRCVRACVRCGSDRHNDAQIVIYMFRILDATRLGAFHKQDARPWQKRQEGRPCLDQPGRGYSFLWGACTVI